MTQKAFQTMHPSLAQRPSWHRTTLFALVATSVVLVACKDQAPEPQLAALPPAAAPAPVIPSPPVPEPQAAPQASPVAPSAPAVPKKVPLSIQGVAEAGVTVRVKAVEMGPDATVLDVSISYANRITNTTMLALADTYLQDESGARLHIQRPASNRNLTVREGETLDGQLVFMGTVSPSTRHLKLVFNEGNDPDNIVAPGLAIELPLEGG